MTQKQKVDGRVLLAEVAQATHAIEKVLHAIKAGTAAPPAETAGNKVVDFGVAVRVDAAGEGHGGGGCCEDSEDEGE